MKHLIASISLILFTSFSLAQTCDHHFPTNKTPIDQSVQILCKERFAIGFSMTHKIASWTSQSLTYEAISSPNTPRKNNFKPDFQVPLSKQSVLSAYANTDFDRGHLVPFDDVADNQIAADESFFLTNIVPQYANHNRGIWKALETRIRKLPLTRQPAYVITGSIFSPTSKTLKDGTVIPDKLFKIAFVPSTKQSYTFIIPNLPNLDTSKLESYMVTQSKLRRAKPELVNLFPKGYKDNFSLK